MEDHHKFLHQPLLPPATAAAFSDNHHDVTLRILLISLISIISIWANYEASKGFELTIINDLHVSNKAASKSFNLLYVSNDKATRIVLNASDFAEKILYSRQTETFNKKKVKHVTLHLASHNINNFTKLVRVDAVKNEGYVIYLSPLIMEDIKNVDYAMKLAIQRAMARVWIWDGASPPWMVEAVVEDITMMAGFGGGELRMFRGDDDVSLCLKEDEGIEVGAHFLSYCEMREEGFIGRVNDAIRDGWNNRTVGNALKISHLCDSYKKTFV